MIFHPVGKDAPHQVRSTRHEPIRELLLQIELAQALYPHHVCPHLSRFQKMKVIALVIGYISSRQHRQLCPPDVPV